MQSTYESKVLIVDDIKINRQLLASVLSNYNIIEAGSGEEALAIVAVNKPDIILLDIRMPGIDGFEVCAALKQSSDSVGIPVIFITGNDEPGQAGRCFEVGAVDFLAKPFDLNEVNARVHTHLALKMAKESLEDQNRLLAEKVREQRLNIKLASRVLSLINPQNPRMINLGSQDYLYAKVMGRSCKEAGGDHYMIKEMTGEAGAGKTLVSIKDQSGHAVNCILRCIITDLLHNSSIYTAPESSLAQKVTLLNNAICSSALFREEDFFTALFLELDHQSRRLQFVSAGHPPFLLIRNGEVKRFPAPDDKGANLPMGFQEGVSYCAGETVLQPGDKLLMYTDGLTDMPQISPNSQTVSADDLVAMVRGIVKSGKGATVSELMADLLDAMNCLSRGNGGDVSDAYDLVDDVTLLGMEMECVKQVGSEHSFVPANYGGIDAVVDAVVNKTLDNVSEYGGEVDFYGLRMALSEGIVNAYVHGNSGDATIPIIIGWQFANDLLVSIKDGGKGEAVLDIANPTRLENRIQANGRGFFYMKKYADYVGWQGGDSTLLLAFSIKGHSWVLQESGTESTIDLWSDPLPGFL